MVLKNKEKEKSSAVKKQYFNDYTYSTSKMLIFSPHEMKYDLVREIQANFFSGRFYSSIVFIGYNIGSKQSLNGLELYLNLYA